MAEIRIAAAQYHCEALPSFAGYAEKLDRWVAEAAGQGAELLVFPEYAGAEFAALAGPDVAADAQASIDALTELLPRIDALHGALAARHRVHIVAGSTAIRRDGLTPNVARLFTPDGRVGVQDKRMMTRGERDDWRVTRGGPLNVFETRLGIVGIAICYDVEFPLLVRAQALAGAQVILAPSYTEKEFGYSRVRVGAMARALENQFVTVQAPLVGEAPWSAMVDLAAGRAGVYGPPDRGFPPSGVIAEGDWNRPQWVYASADLAAVDLARRDGMVLNHRHWVEQEEGEPAPATLVSLL